MSNHTTIYDVENLIIRVTIEGSFDLSLLRVIAGNVKEISDSENCKHILNDLRGAVLKDALDIFKMPYNAKEHGIHEGYKRALLVHSFSEDVNFLENVFRNRGHLVKLFTDEDQAIQWLTDPRP